MNNIIFNVNSQGGIFSKFMFYVYNYIYIPEPDNIYIETSDDRANKIENPFNFIFQQNKLYNSRILNCGHLGNKTKFDQIKNDTNFNRYRNAVSKLKFNEEFNSIINNNKWMVENDVLGVHVRVTDMNLIHSEYGLYNTEDYINKIKNYPIDKKIFIASDNYESISLIKNEFGDRVLYVKEMHRAEKENDNTYFFQENNLSEKFLWQEAFLDMILLSMCSSMIIRTSNLANVAMLYAKKEQIVDWL